MAHCQTIQEHNKGTKKIKMHDVEETVKTIRAMIARDVKKGDYSFLRFLCEPANRHLEKQSYTMAFHKRPTDR